MGIAVDSFIGKRETNQDYIDVFVNKSDQTLAILCDGMGGHRGGDVASEMAVTQLGNKWSLSSFESVAEVQEWLTLNINEENSRIFNAGNIYEDLKDMGTTIVAAVIINDEIIIANVGDSRAYSYQNFELELITVDHSYANELYLTGEINREEAQNHAQKNTLTRSLGVSADVSIDFFMRQVKSSDYVFLCSDGLSNHLTEKEMVLALMADLPIKERAQSMIQTAYNNGSTDNISIIIIDINKIKREGENDGNRR